MVDINYKGENMEKMVVETSLLQEVLDYLSSRPYREVSGLVTKIMNAAANQTPRETETVANGQSN